MTPLQPPRTTPVKTGGGRGGVSLNPREKTKMGTPNLKPSPSTRVGLINRTSKKKSQAAENEKRANISGILPNPKTRTQRGQKNLDEIGGGGKKGKPLVRGKGVKGFWVGGSGRKWVQVYVHHRDAVIQVGVLTTSKTEKSGKKTLEGGF